jgi:hypothetical protein
MSIKTISIILGALAVLASLTISSPAALPGDGGTGGQCHSCYTSYQSCFASCRSRTGGARSLCTSSCYLAYEDCMTSYNCP